MLREINDIDGMQFGFMEGKITMDAIMDCEADPRVTTTLLCGAQ